MSISPTRFYEFGPFRLDAQRCLLLRAGEPVALSPKVFETLLVLVESRGRVVRKDELLERIWPGIFVEEGNLTQNVFVLRKALGEGPNDHRYIVTVPGRGYRFVAGVRETGGEPATVAPPRERQPGEPPAAAGRAARVDGAAAVASIAVLPFKTLGNGGGEEQYLGPGLADALITRLSHLRRIAVMSTATVLNSAGPGRDPLAIGRELGVETVLDGFVQRAGGRVRVTLQLVSTRSGEALWAEKFDGECGDIFSVQDSISEQVARALALELSADEQRLLTKHHTANAEAFQAYIKGRYFWNKRTLEGLRKALEYAQQAISIDPAYARAYVGLADAYNLLAGHGGLAPRETFPKAKRAALAALEIDDTLAEAYASLGFVNYRYEWDWEESERNFARAAELKPNYATARHWRGESLAAAARLEESLAELRRAQEIDPLSLPVNTDLAQSLYFARRYEESAEQSRKTLEMDESFARALVIYGAALEGLGRYEEAERALSRAVELSERNPLALSGLGHVYAASGRAGEARQILGELEQLARGRYVSAYNIAVVHAGLGDDARALDLLERAVEDRDVWLVWLKVNPRLDRLRGEPRFRALTLFIHKDSMCL